jgi:RimJ/RimL family protein N-acetyltransferase
LKPLQLSNEMTDTLRSERLTLRRLALEDAAHFARLLGGDTESLHMMSQMPDPCTEAAAREWIEMRTGSGRIFAILRSEDGEFLGAIGLGGSLEMLELGYWIGRPHWGQGYATEAVCAVVELARALGGIKMQAETFPHNPASARVLEKAGFKNIGKAVKDFPARGGLREVYQHVLDLR